jgi:hypothetical protein
MSTKKGPWPRVRRGIRGARQCGTGKLSVRLKSEGHHWPYSARRGERAPSALAKRTRTKFATKIEISAVVEGQLM